jgi:LPS export ABC transporter protein LptC
MRIRGLAAISVTVLLVVGCSLDYRSAELGAQGSENIPDAVISGLTYRMVKNSRLSIELEASRAEAYDSKKQTLITDARLTEFNDQGKAVTEGRADSVTYHSDTDDAEISGRVYVHSETEKGAISAESLNWKDKDKLLTTDPNELVVLKKDDGSYISGRGFSGDFKKKQMTFTGPVEGAYVYEDETE